VGIETTTYHSRSELSTTDLFNKILDSGHFPESWRVATIVLNKRLLDWSNKNNIVPYAQNGFKPGCGISDAIFTLDGLISKSFKSQTSVLLFH
jgi:hypothetical protein